MLSGAASGWLYLVIGELLTSQRIPGNVTEWKSCESPGMARCLGRRIRVMASPTRRQPTRGSPLSRPLANTPYS